MFQLNLCHLYWKTKNKYYKHKSNDLWRNLIRLTPIIIICSSSISGNCGDINVDHFHVFWYHSKSITFWENIHRLTLRILGHVVSRTCVWLYVGWNISFGATESLDLDQRGAVLSKIGQIHKFIHHRQDKNFHADANIEQILETWRPSKLLSW